MKNLKILSGLILLSIILISPLSTIYAQELWSYNPSKGIPKYDHSNREWSINAISMGEDANFIAVGLVRENIFIDDKGNILKDDQGNYLSNKESKIVFLNNKGEELWSFRTQHKIIDIKMDSKAEYIVVETYTSSCFTDFEKCGGKVYVFNKSGTPLWTYDGAETPYVDSFGNVLIATPNGTAIYDIEKKLIRRYSNDLDYIWASDNLDLFVIPTVLWEEDEMSRFKLIYSKLELFDKNGKKLWEREIEEQLRDVIFSDDGNLIVGIPYIGHTLHIFDRKGNLSKYSTKEIKAFSMTPDGKYIVVAERSYFFNNKHITPITLLNQSAEVLWKADIESSTFHNIKITNDGKYIYLFTDTELIVLDARTGEIKNIIGIWYLFQPCLSKNGEYLAAGKYKLYLFDTQTLDTYSNNTKNTPGFELLSLVSGSILVAYILNKRKR